MTLVEGERGASLNDDERETIFELAETLIPPGHSGPSADEAGVSAQFLDEVLALRKDLFGKFQAIVEEARGRDPRKFCESLQRDRPADFNTLTFIIAGAYFLSPKVRDWLEYKGQIGEFQPGEMQSEYLEGGLLDQVRARGPIFRPTPTA